MRVCRRDRGKEKEREGGEGEGGGGGRGGGREGGGGGGGGRRGGGVGVGGGGGVKEAERGRTIRAEAPTQRPGFHLVSDYFCVSSPLSFPLISCLSMTISVQ